MSNNYASDFLQKFKLNVIFFQKNEKYFKVIWKFGLEKFMAY